ncbi:MAG TPA: phospholipase [Micromonosporaceae bacterium]
MGLDHGPPALMYLPPHPKWLVVTLHGAGGRASDGLRLLRGRADGNGLLLLAPQSVAGTWDLLLDGYGPDIDRISDALRRVLATYPLSGSLAIGGFSDGASYALSLGITNGDLFDRVIAFSPGFMSPMSRLGTPSVYVSHGRQDRVLPIDRCSRRIVPALREAGYDVEYQEFDGGHVVPEEVVSAAVDWLASDTTEGGPKGRPQ